MKKYIIIHSDKAEQKIDTQPYSKAANAIMNAPGYIEYIKEHGYHFTDKLALYLSERMQAACGTEHLFQSFPSTPVLHNETQGDLVYTANMAFADFYPKVLSTTDSCLDYARAVAQDPDGYEGMEFMRWTSDAIGKGISINWEEFI